MGEALGDVFEAAFEVGDTVSVCEEYVFWVTYLSCVLHRTTLEH